MPHEVSVVVPHYGDPAPTRALLDALLAQGGRDDLQLIVADDASEPPFPEVDGVEVVRRTSNGGFGSAVNTGAAVARHPLLLVLNSDLEVGPTFLTDLLAAAAPWLPAVVSPRVVDREGRPAWTGRHFPTTRHQTVEWLTPLARLRDRPRLHEAVGHDTEATKATTVVDWVIGAALLLPTADFRAVGGFDEQFFMNAEEVDLQRRLQQRGLRAVGPRRARRRPRGRRVQRPGAPAALAGHLTPAVRREVGRPPPAPGRPDRGDRGQPGLEHRATAGRPPGAADSHGSPRTRPDL